MAKIVEILRDHLPEHAAARAWSVLNSRPVAPEMIAVIKVWEKKMKSGVYRLAGVGQGGSAVMAKRCLLQTGAVERAIYEEFLPRLDLPSLEYYGSVEDEDGRSIWLFLEEAGGDLYSPENPEHRALAARWLAAVHTGGRRLGWEPRWPDRGPEQYLQRLRACRSRLREYFTHPNLRPEGVAVLETVSEQCALLESRWREFEEICQATPRTLMHGDFVVKNLRVRAATGGPELLVFDWEFAGWGAPATDLAQFTGHVASPDLSVYRDCVEGDPGPADDSQIQRLAACGRFFRIVDILHWTCLGEMVRPPKIPFTPVKELKVYSQRLAEALSEAGWITHV